MNKRDAGLQVLGNRLFLIFCFFCIKTKEKHTVFEPFNLRIYFENFTKKSFQNNFDKIDILMTTDDFIFLQKISL